MTYPVPAREIRRELVVQGSRFIATLVPVSSLQEARAFLARMRAEFSDATHNVPAWLIGGGNSVLAHAADDGEPAGTAGRPALAVLQGSGLGDVAVVITRYFGGTKLGTGGLVRAYTRAVQAVVADVPRAQKLLAHTALLALPYNLLEQIRLLAGKYHGEVLAEDFAAEITMRLRFACAEYEGFVEALQEVSSGRLKPEIIATGEILLPVQAE
ncbi:MAG: YigZ family protein [Anaerolineales bacterium]|nr:YigZ family protein [Anaerolineales bacterium]